MSKSGNYSIGKSVLKYPRGQAEIRKGYTYKLEPRSHAHQILRAAEKNNDIIPKKLQKKTNVKTLKRWEITNKEYQTTELGKRKLSFANRLRKIMEVGNLKLHQPSKLTELTITRIMNSNVNADKIDKDLITNTTALAIKESSKQRLLNSSKSDHPLLSLISEFTDKDELTNIVSLPHFRTLNHLRKEKINTIKQWVDIENKYYKIFNEAVYGRGDYHNKRYEDISNAVTQSLNTCIKEDGLSNPERFESIMKGIEVFY